MKINRLKFKQINHMVNNKSLQLNLFEKEDQFLHTDIKFENSNLTMSHLHGLEKTKRQKVKHHSKASPRTAREKNHYRNASYINSLSKRDNCLQEDSLYFLQASLTQYVTFISSDQSLSIKKDFQSILQIVSLQSFKQIQKKMQNHELNLSKYFKNRIIHLAFYLLHNRLLKFQMERNLQQEIKHLLFCEYYSRKFNFKDLTLSICIQIHEIYRMNNNYQQSRKYARKCLRLAVVLGNQFYQSKMIQSLNIINYYEGRLNQASTLTLNKHDRRRIIENYNEQSELPNIFNFKGFMSQNDRELAIQHNTNFVENGIPQQNYKYFQSNYHDIVKNIQGKPINIRGIINKVTSVGMVKKYFGKDNYIVIRPECHIIKPINQQQVLITHKKEINNHKKQESLSKLLKRIVNLLEYAIQEYSFYS